MRRISKEEFLSIPNIMCYFRLILIPIFCYVYLTAEDNRHYYIAAGIVLVATLTDFFDGQIARRCNMNTELGKFIDPVADKFMHIAIAFCLATRYTFMWVLFGLLVVKEGYMGVMGVINLQRGKKLDGAKWFGKICTGTLFISMILLVIIPDMKLFYVNTLLVTNITVMIITLILYMGVFRKMKQDNIKVAS